jgi:hypothetical protein
MICFCLSPVKPVDSDPRVKPGLQLLAIIQAVGSSTQLEQQAATACHTTVRSGDAAEIRCWKIPLALVQLEVSGDKNLRFPNHVSEVFCNVHTPRRNGTLVLRVPGGRMRERTSSLRYAQAAMPYFAIT